MGEKMFTTTANSNLLSSWNGCLSRHNKLFILDHCTDTDRPQMLKTKRKSPVHMGNSRSKDVVGPSSPIVSITADGVKVMCSCQQNHEVEFVCKFT